MFKHRWLFSATFILLAIFISSISIAKEVKVSVEQKSIEVEGVASEELGKYAEQLQGAIEYFACAIGGKTYESLFVLDCNPTEFYNALIKIGLKPGSPFYEDESGKRIPPKGDTVRLYIEWKNPEGKTMRFRAEDLVYNRKTKKPMQHIDWVFTGSRFMEDPATDEIVLQAELTKSIVATFHGDRSVILQNPLMEAIDESLYEANSKLLPKAGTKIKMIVDGSPFVRFNVLISGKVQGVGFRDFTKQKADQMGVFGYVKNLPNGKVEAVLEGRESDLNGLMEKLRIGPESAKVEDVKVEKKEFTGKYKDFKIEE